MIVITAAVYLPALTFDLVYDDQQQIVMNGARLQWHSLPGYFKTDIWSPIGFMRTNYYRPVFLTWLMLNYQLFGVNAMLWHASAIVCHLAATLLFYFLARRLVGDPLLAGFAALLFGVHPVHVETVAWVSGATEPLFAVFALGTILCHVHGGRRWRAAALLLMAAALFAKETAVVLPPLIVAYEWSWTKRLKQAAKAAIPYLLVTVAYLLARVLALGALAPVQNRWPGGAVMRSLPFAFWFYLRQLAVPSRYSVCYPIQPVRDIGLTHFVLPLLAIALTVAALLWVSTRSRVAAFGTMLLVIPLLPVMNLAAFRPHDYVHDRYAYLPAAGFCLLAALGLNRLPRFTVRAGIAMAATAALAVVTISTSRSWSDERSLFSRAARVAPENPIALAYWGKTLAHDGRYHEALATLKKALFLDLENFELHGLVAQCYFGMGQLDEAERYLADAIRLAPKFPDSYLNLAMIDARRGRLPDAEAHLRQALRLRPFASPLYAGYHSRLGQVLETKGDLKGALAEYEAELAENPEAEDARDRLEALRHRN